MAAESAGTINTGELFKEISVTNIKRPRMKSRPLVTVSAIKRYGKEQEELAYGFAGSQGSWQLL
jgi:hypothetical protein